MSAGGGPRGARLLRELAMLQQDPPPGVAVALKEGDRQLDRFRCQILGVPGTPFEEGVFEVDVAVGERYPFEPPSVRFLTPVYHPNIDKEGRICLDLLKMPPAGSWKPSLNLSSLLTSIRVLLGAPNPDDGLMADISAQYKNDRGAFARAARRHTQQYASQHVAEMAVTTLPCDESGLGPELEEEEPKAKKGKALEAQPAW